MNNNLKIKDFITPIAVNTAGYFVNDMFKRKFKSKAPERGYHLVAFYRHNNHYLPVGYLHYSPYVKCLLVGGGMTDGNVIKMMKDEEKKAIADENGILKFMLKYGFEYFADNCIAFFGHIDIPRSMEVSLEAGFQETKYKYLVANFHKPISKWKKHRLIETLNKVGSF